MTIIFDFLSNKKTWRRISYYFILSATEFQQKSELIFSKLCLLVCCWTLEYFFSSNIERLLMDIRVQKQQCEAHRSELNTHNSSRASITMNPIRWLASIKRNKYHRKSKMVLLQKNILWLWLIQFAHNKRTKMLFFKIVSFFFFGRTIYWKSISRFVLVISHPFLIS